MFLLTVFLSSEWEDYGFKKGEIVEIGYHNEEAELVEADSEDAEHLWCQSWGTWNPITSDYMTGDHVTHLGEHLDWRSPDYKGLNPELIRKAEEIVNNTL